MPRILKACVYRAGKPLHIGDVELDLSIKVLSLVVFIRCEWSIRDRSATRLGTDAPGYA
jgi:hypothetical protein